MQRKRREVQQISQGRSLLLSRLVRPSFIAYSWLNPRNSDALGDDGFNKSNTILEFKSKWQNIAFDQVMDLKARNYPAEGENDGLETDVRYPADW